MALQDSDMNKNHRTQVELLHRLLEEQNMQKRIKASLFPLFLMTWQRFSMQKITLMHNSLLMRSCLRKQESVPCTGENEFEQLIGI